MKQYFDPAEILEGKLNQRVKILTRAKHQCIGTLVEIDKKFIVVRDEFDDLEKIFFLETLKTVEVL